ncbi:hypothetical protein [Jeotgalibacillus haloalkalitolerans]|uniref:Uncharacterized protein n=1 Tax=Jeotgalibacillus haloalkalitolerans TaxID=3104292 RepID=A0ABU5KQT4_9BACL|nr:hypothetical protein [Jeotgalibacillus sp. HH7-29]MDZ5713616.1 hypothetical protein [Jeotgalibacillus sp. HH7-29]
MSLLPFHERYNLVEVPEDYDNQNPDFIVMRDEHDKCYLCDKSDAEVLKGLNFTEV